jgi:hypothetical protein
MDDRWPAIIGVALIAVSAGPRALAAPPERGPYARIAVLRPHDGKTVEFEAGYVRHLEWHRQARDSWAWYGWSIWAGERQRYFVYATFGRTAASLDAPVSPADDERDNVLNVAPHVEWAGNALYEFLPALSRGTGEPTPLSRLELTTVDLVPGGETVFESAIGAAQSALTGETLWYRMVAGGGSPRYLRLRPRARLSAILEDAREAALPEAAFPAVAKKTVELLTLRRTMSLGLPEAPGE